MTSQASDSSTSATPDRNEVDPATIQQDHVSHMGPPPPEMMLHSMMAGMVTPVQNPIQEKVTEEHVTQVLEMAERASARQYEWLRAEQARESSNRAYGLAVLGLVMLVLVILILLLRGESPELLVQLLTGFTGFTGLAAGAIGGYGFGRGKG